MGCFGKKNFRQILKEVRVPALLGYRNNAKSRISKIDKQYFNLISLEFRKLIWCKNDPFCLKEEFLSFNWEIWKNLKKRNFWSKMAFFSQKSNFTFLLKTECFNLESKDLKTKLNSEAPDKIC